MDPELQRLIQQRIMGGFGAFPAPGVVSGPSSPMAGAPMPRGDMIPPEVAVATHNPQAPMPQPRPQMAPPGALWGTGGMNADMMMQPQPAAAPAPAAPQNPFGGSLFSKLPEGFMSTIGDIGLGLAMGATPSQSLAGAAQMVAQGRDKRKEEARMNKTREAAKAFGIPGELADSLDGKTLMALLADAQLKRMGADAKGEFRTLTDPAERKLFGIPETDKAVYQLGPDNKISRVGEGGVNVTIADQAAERAKIAREMGYDENSDQYKSFVLTGKLPREDQQTLTAIDKQAIQESDDAAMNAQRTLSLLDKAMEVNDKAYEGLFAGTRGQIGAMLGVEGGKETLDLNNIVTEQALSQLKAIFGGAPTEGERTILLQIAGSADQPAAVRKDIFDRARQAVQARMQYHANRAAELRAGTYYQPSTAKETAAPAPAAPSGYKILGVE